MKQEDAKFLKEYGKRMRDLAGYVNVLLRERSESAIRCLDFYKYVPYHANIIYTKIETLLKNDNNDESFSNRYDVSPSQIFEEVKDFYHNILSEVEPASIEEEDKRKYLSTDANYSMICKEVGDFYDALNKKSDLINPQAEDDFEPANDEQCNDFS